MATHDFYPCSACCKGQCIFCCSFAKLYAAHSYCCCLICWAVCKTLLQAGSTPGDSPSSTLQPYMVPQSMTLVRGYNHKLESAGRLNGTHHTEVCSLHSALQAVQADNGHTATHS